MNRLQQELQRLYGAQAEPDADQAADAPADAQQRGRAVVRAMVRAMVLELARPSDWAALSAVWAGVQADLALPAPAIAVNGSDGCQLWFSLQEPVAGPRAGAFLDALRRRYLGDVAPARLALLPVPHGVQHAVPDGPPRPARPVPALQADSGQWSAFVTPDLVPMFTDEPWLAMPPNPDGQATVLAPLQCTTPAAFELAWQRLLPAGVPAVVLAEVTAAPGPPAPADGGPDPRRFLLDVMHNDRLDLALRIDAAKALLPFFHAAQGTLPDPGADHRKA